MSHSVLITPAASGEIATLFVGFELSKSAWLIGLYAAELGKTDAKRSHRERAVCLLLRENRGYHAPISYHSGVGV
jgi:hypothetical protein